MSDIAEIKSELGGNTNFDEGHEGELFERIAAIEDEERDAALIPGLAKSDYVLIVVMFLVLGVLPVVRYAVMYL